MHSACAPAVLSSHRKAANRTLTYVWLITTLATLEICHALLRRSPPERPNVRSKWSVEACLGLTQAATNAPVGSEEAPKAAPQLPETKAPEGAASTSFASAALIGLGSIAILLML